MWSVECVMKSESAINFALHTTHYIFSCIFSVMSWECKYLRETFCDKRKQECCPGAKGCVLEGRFAFPLRTDVPEKSPKKKD